MDSNAQDSAQSSGKSRSTRDAKTLFGDIGQTQRSGETSEASTDRPDAREARIGAPVRSSGRLTSSAEDSRAKGSPLQAEGVASLILAAAFGPSSSELLARLSPRTLSWRTAHSLTEEDWTSFCSTLPRSGMTQSGSLFRRQTWGPRTVARGSSWWPTPTTSDAICSRRHGYMLTGHAGTTLTDAIVSHHAGATRKAGEKLKSPWAPNPAFVEMLMGFPSNWTRPESPPSATPSSRRSRKSSGGS